MLFIIIFLCILDALFCFAFDRFVCSRFFDDGRFQLLPWFFCVYFAFGIVIFIRDNFF